jgi:hypothetical protein
MTKQRNNSTKSSNGANLGFEQKLWAAADKLRGHMDASEYKHVVLGLIFLKYISDAFEERHPAALGCILADEFEEADFDGSLINRSTILASATKPSHGHSELADLHAHIYGDVAYVRGIGVNIENGRPSGKTRFTDVFVYRDGRWQCVAGHDSRFPEAR